MYTLLVFRAESLGKRKTFSHQDSFQFCCFLVVKDFSPTPPHFWGKLNLSDGVGIYLMTLNDVYHCTQHQQRAFSQALIAGSTNTGWCIEEWVILGAKLFLQIYCESFLWALKSTSKFNRVLWKRKAMKTDTKFMKILLLIENSLSLFSTVWLLNL